MKTNLADFIRDTPEGKEANAILRACVHCGFCTATCPTYQLLGDELDGPRGRIYLMKELFEGGRVSHKTQLHLDRCLTCRSCETTCPSGVRYGRLVDIGRNVVEKEVGRSFGAALVRSALKTVLTHPVLFNPLLRLGQLTRPLLPGPLASKVPPRVAPTPWPPARHSRRMLVLEGCVQPAIAPTINPAMARVLDRIGISLIAAPAAGCCGAVAYHLNAQDQALDLMRKNIDAWWPYVEQGVEAIVATASGCGVMVDEYGHLLERDPRYADKARRISQLTKDAAEVIAAQRRSHPRQLKPRTGRLESGISFALHAAARPADSRRWRTSWRRRLAAHRRARRPSVLRLRGHIFHPAVQTLRQAAGQQGRRARVGLAAGHCHRQHRVSRAHPDRHAATRPPLGGAPRRRAGVTATRYRSRAKCATVQATILHVQRKFRESS
jgi:glycolate oxidase iron-sulfur subunit